MKLEDSDETIDWTKTFGWEDISMIVPRCMNKYRSDVPKEISSKRLTSLVQTLPGFKSSNEPSMDRLNQIRLAWQIDYDENLEKVTYDHISSYEP